MPEKKKKPGTEWGQPEFTPPSGGGKVSGVYIAGQGGSRYAPATHSKYGARTVATLGGTKDRASNRGRGGLTKTQWTDRAGTYRGQAGPSGTWGMRLPNVGGGMGGDGGTPTGTTGWEEPGGGAGGDGGAGGGAGGGGAGTVPGLDYDAIMDQFQTAQDAANAANEARYQEGLGLWGDIQDIYGPEGTFGAGYEAQLERTKTKDVASARQHMAGAGLWNTTVAAAIPQAWEEDVGQPSRLSLADMQAGRYAGALAGTAGFTERRYDTGPDMGLFANLMQGAYAGPMTGGTTGTQTGHGEPVGTPMTKPSTRPWEKRKPGAGGGGPMTSMPTRPTSQGIL